MLVLLHSIFSLILFIPIINSCNHEALQHYDTCYVAQTSLMTFCVSLNAEYPVFVERSIGGQWRCSLPEVGELGRTPEAESKAKAIRTDWGNYFCVCATWVRTIVTCKHCCLFRAGHSKTFGRHYNAKPNLVSRIKAGCSFRALIPMSFCCKNEEKKGFGGLYIV